jgi:acyl carrier protein
MNLLELIADGFTAVTGRPAPAIALDDDIAGLGLDSLAMMELVAWSEERLGVRVPDEELTTVRTVGDLVALFSSRIVAGTP